jgi:DNA polymerase I-like protein with 3'-5' exonuclease and polymerase domains
MKSIKKVGAYLIFLSYLLGPLSRAQAMEADGLQKERMQEDNPNVEQIAQKVVKFIKQGNLIKVMQTLSVLEPEKKAAVVNYSVHDPNHPEEQKTALHYALEIACVTIVAVLRNVGAQGDQTDLERRAQRLKGRARERILACLQRSVPYIRSIDK